MNIEHHSTTPLHPIHSLGLAVRVPVFQTSLTFWPTFFPYHDFWFAVLCCVFNFKLYVEIKDTMNFCLISYQVWWQCCHIITNIVVGGGTAAIVTICTTNVLFYYYSYHNYYYYNHIIIFIIIIIIIAVLFILIEK